MKKTLLLAASAIQSEGEHNDVLRHLIREIHAMDGPLLGLIGAAYDVDFASHSVLTLSSELKHSNDNDEKGAIGAQLGFDEKFFLRGGYKINYDEEGLTVGGGINTGLSSSTRLIIDYAWQDFGRLESTLPSIH